MQVRTTISIEDEVLTQVKILAVKKKCTIGYIFEEGAKIYLEKEKQKKDKDKK